MAEKKISFGFKQVKKQPMLLPIKSDDDKKKNDVELIQCLEGQTIKLVHEKEKEKLLVIPLLNSQKTSTALASLKNLKTVLNGDEQNDEVNNAQKTNDKTENVPLSLEQRVIKELLNEAKNDDNDEDDAINGKLTLPMAADKLPLDGAKESNIDDYDNIPIAQFGLAMLRGMGLKDEEIKSKQNKEPELRPKGMGLGADKVIKKAKLLVAPAANETLEIKKNAYVRILGGKFKDLYGQIEGLDDHACRVIVKLALGGSKEVFNEFMVQPISKQEYQQYGKVINSAKYEEYKRKQEEKELKKEMKAESSTIKKERAVSRERSGSNSRSNRDPSPKYSKNTDEHGSSSRRRERSRDRSRERVRERSRDKSRDRNERTRNRSRDKERNRRSPSYDQSKTKDVDRGSYKSRTENRRSRSVDKYNSKTSSSRTDRSRDDKHSRRPERSRSSSDGSSSDSDSPDDSRRDKRSHHKKSKKKHKKKSSKKYDSSDDDRHIKKKTKKSKRERSRSTGRR